MSEDCLDIFFDFISLGATGSSAFSIGSAWIVDILILKGGFALIKESFSTGKEGSGNGFGAAGATWLEFCC